MAKTVSLDKLELPPRKWSWTEASIAAMTIRRGGSDAEVARSIKMHSHAEWDEDLEWIQFEKERQNLSDAQCEVLKALARKRNREFWGVHSWTPDYL